MRTSYLFNVNVAKRHHITLPLWATYMIFSTTDELI